MNAKTVARHLLAKATQIKDIAVGNATARRLRNMKNKEYDHELGYVIEKALAKQLLDMELITPEQYAEVKKMLIEEYKPLIGSLCEALSSMKRRSNVVIFSFPNKGESFPVQRYHIRSP